MWGLLLIRGKLTPKDGDEGQRQQIEARSRPSGDLDDGFEEMDEEEWGDAYGHSPHDSERLSPFCLKVIEIVAWGSPYKDQENPHRDVTDPLSEKLHVHRLSLAPCLSVNGGVSEVCVRSGSWAETLPA